MEINDFNELNALNKLLIKVKYSSDLDFQEFREFAGSPIINEIFRRVNEQFLAEFLAKNPNFPLARFEELLEFESRIGKVIQLRIDGLTEHEIETLKQNDSIDEYLNIHIGGRRITSQEFEKFRSYLSNEKNT